MKKMMFATIVLSMFLTACGGSQPAPAPVETPAETPAEAPAETPAEASAETPSEAAETIVVGLDDSFPPMGFRDNSGNIVGFDIDLAKEVCTRMGVEAVFQPIDWASKELELAGKKIDLLWNGVTITPERLAIWAFTEPYIANRQIIIVKNDSDINAKADLEGKIVGVQKESSAVSAIEADPISASFGELLEYPDNISAFLDLDIGRADAVVADEILARYYISQQKPDFRVLEDNFGDEEYGVAGRLEDTELMENVQNALNDMMEDGTYDEIYDKWFD